MFVSPGRNCPELDCLCTFLFQLSVSCHQSFFTSLLRLFLLPQFHSVIKQSIAHIALLVEDYDDAIRFYTGKLHFTLVEDTLLSESKRWVILSPPGSAGCSLLLARAANAEQKKAIGNQTGGRVFLFLHTDDFERDFQDMISQGIVFVRPPAKEPYGTVAVFQDLYGNLWDLIEPSR